ncbi:hypothetical protein [Nocardia sp. alder85J]|uniref:hypothetical protein n=1 Tax=Nocardia sp. alder85J TaxID=2862949 RepID=UPI001CD38874|nr:hypothetical protein [Nocardia sp. alder85J]MCX4097702.1 hypothetical protein [Nocardia sp. alder85J]
MSRDDTPIAPTRERALLPAQWELALYAGSAVLVAVFGGGALSGLLAGHGLPAPGWHAITAVLAGLWRHPGDPAAAWPADPRPGPAWLTWLCITSTAAVFLLTVELARAEFHRRRRHRRRHQRSGLAVPADLHRAGLDSRSAVRKARKEYPNLAATSGVPGRRTPGRRQR